MCPISGVDAGQRPFFMKKVSWSNQSSSPKRKDPWREVPRVFFVVPARRGKLHHPVKQRGEESAFDERGSWVGFIGFLASFRQTFDPVRLLTMITIR